MAKWLFPLSVFTLSSLRAHVLITSHKDSVHIGVGPTHMTLYYLNYLFKYLITVTC